MKKFLFSAILLTLFSCSNKDDDTSDTILNGIYVIDTVEKYNNFNYTEITGDLIINTSTLTSLTNLRSLEVIGGRLAIHFTPIRNLDGLQGLKTVGNELYLNSLSELTSLDGLNNLEEIEGSLTIKNCPNLIQIDALSNLHTVGSVDFAKLPKLESIEGIANVTSAVKKIDFRRLESLQSISALRNFERTPDSDLTLNNLNSLPNLNGLEGYAEFQSCYITHCSNLSSIESLSNLKNIGGGFALMELPSLTSLNGLQNLETIGISELILDYPQALIAYLDGITNLEGLTSLSTVGQLTISNNQNLMSLDGTNLQNCVENSCRISIGGNPNLTDFCGFQTFALNNSFDSFQVGSNAYNPTIAQMRSETECRQ